MEPGLLGWELAFHRRTLGVKSLPELTQAICEAAADGISSLGVEARFRPRNDIEVAGRKISGTGGFFDGDTLFYQGTVLVDMNPGVMVSALRVPQAKLEKRALDSAAQRVVTLRELLGDKTPDLATIQSALVAAFAGRFGLEPLPAPLSAAERETADTLYREEIGTEEFVTEIEEPPAARGDLCGRHTGAGGTVTAYLRLEGPAQNRLRAALFTGDFFITPPRVIYDLESHLRGVYLHEVESVVREFFERSDVEVLSVSPADFNAAIDQALAQA
jgi:lipoate-protein ligase A